MQWFANPARFTRLADALLPFTIAATGVLIALGLYMGLVVSPADYQQGDSVRIMYVHVPSAWMCLFVYMTIAGASAVSLIWRHPLADIAGKAAAPIGLAFTGLALVTGAIWGKPMWGTWWAWDGRLTSVLVLFFLYLGYMALWSALDDRAKAARAAAILALVGTVNIPIIKFSVDWWTTLHQPASVMRLDGPTIHPSMLWPLVIMALGFMFYFATVLLWRMKAELAAAKVAQLKYAGSAA